MNDHERYLFAITCVFAGKTRIGSGRASVKQDIVLQGPGICEQHCYIVNNDVEDVLTLCPLTGQLSVDGLPVTSPTKLVQGSRYSFTHSESLIVSIRKQTAPHNTC